MKKLSLVALCFIVIAASVLRIYKLGENPPGLTWDEASLGYNAYSLMKTGNDEYGAHLPLTLKSFGDYKPAFYAYLTIPSVAFFDLNEFSVRLPSALLGVIAVIMMFLIARKMFVSESIGLLAAFVLAISPWHIHFSRGAWEANVAMTLLLIGLYWFLWGLEKPKWFLLTAFFFALSLYTYQSSRLFMPLLACALVLIYWNQLKKITRWHVITIIAGIAFLIPFVTIISSSVARQRLTVQSLFSYARPQSETQVLAKEDKQSSNRLMFRLFHSQTELWGRAIVEREIMYLSPSYLFVTGDTEPRHHAPGIAHGYWLDTPFYLLGFYVLMKRPWKHKGLLFAWLLLAPLPAVLSRDSTQALRSLQLVFAVDMIIALGLWYFITVIKTIRFGFLLVPVYVALLAFNVAFYLDAYHVHFPVRTAKYWLTGYKDAITSIENIYKNYDRVVFTTDYNEPYIFVLFYLKIDPSEFQTQAHLTATRGIDVGEVEKFNNFTFRHIYWPDDRALPDTLFVGTEEELPQKDLVTEPRAQLLQTLKFPDQTISFKVVGTRSEQE